MPFRSSCRTAARAGVAILLALLTTVGLAGPAFAHATLIGSDPSEGAVVSTAPTSVTLTFDDSLEDFEPTVVVTGPDGQTYQSGTATIDGAVLRSAVAPLTVAGAYTIAYRVVSDDGHPVEGQVHFQLAESAVASANPASSTGPGTSATAATSSATGSSSASSGAATTVTTDVGAAGSTSSSGWGAWQWVTAILIVAAVFGASMIVRRRMEASRRARAGADPDSTDR